MPGTFSLTTKESGNDVIYAITKHRGPHFPSDWPTGVDHVDTEDSIMEYDGDGWWSYSVAGATPGNPICGSYMNAAGGAGETIAICELYLPADPFRISELDREEINSGNIGSASANLDIGAITRDNRYAEWVDQSDVGLPGSYTLTTLTTNISLSAALAGIKYEGTQWRLHQLTNIGDFAIVDTGTVKKIIVTNFVKDYLTYRNGYSLFLLTMIPAGLGINTLPADAFAAMKGLYNMTVQDSRTYTLDGGGSYTVDGILETYQLSWNGSLFGGGNYNLDMSSGLFSLPAQSRLSYRIPPDQK